MSDTNQDSDLLTLYNYDSFVREKFERWMNFDASPPLGVAAPDFPLLHLDGSETTLHNIWSKHTYTVMEFGSFT